MDLTELFCDVDDFVKNFNQNSPKEINYEFKIKLPIELLLKPNYFANEFFSNCQKIQIATHIQYKPIF